jgi:predicted O-methyltransferase YrrM
MGWLTTETLNRDEMWKGWSELPSPIEGHTGKYINYQEYLYNLVKDLNPKTILEIGFNAGHSACCFLNAAPNAKMVTFDICRHDTEKSAEEVLKKYFDITLIDGDSIETVPQYFEDNPTHTFDLVFIDGWHSDEHPYKDTVNTMDSINKNGILIIDDYNCGTVGQCSTIDFTSKGFEDKNIESVGEYDSKVGIEKSIRVIKKIG